MLLDDFKKGKKEDQCNEKFYLEVLFISPVQGSRKEFYLNTLFILVLLLPWMDLEGE